MPEQYTHMLLLGWKMRKLIISMVLISVLLIACSISEKKESKITEPNQPQNISKANASEAKIACYTDSNCGVRRAENAYCFQGNPIGDLYEWRCDNPGTASSRCVEIHNKGPIATCGDDYFCNNGTCVQYANCNDTDRGINYSVKGKVITNDFAVHEDYCKDSNKLAEYYCSADDRAFSETKDCSCKNGACVS